MTLMLRNEQDSSNRIRRTMKVRLGLISARLLIDIHVNHTTLSMLMYFALKFLLFIWQKDCGR